MLKIIKEMSWITIVGIILLAIGTFMTIYGPLRNSSKDTDSIKEEIAAFSEKLEEAKMENSATTEKGREEIKSLETEFDKWAKQFVTDKAEKQLEFQHADINIKEIELRLSKEWYPIYKKLISDIQNYIDAYNTQSGDSINYEFEEFPTNLFSENIDKLKYVITFSSDRHWVIFFQPSTPLDEDKIPKINLSVVEDLDNWGDAAFFREVEFNFWLKYNEVHIYTSNNIIKISDLGGTFNLSEHPDILIECFKRLIEYELILKT